MFTAADWAYTFGQFYYLADRSPVAAARRYNGLDKAIANEIARVALLQTNWSHGEHACPEAG